MKVTVSIPAPLFEEAEELAARLGLTRSRLYAEALRRFISDDITRRLNEVYADNPSHIDPELMQLQVRAIATDPPEEWP